MNFWNCSTTFTDVTENVSHDIGIVKIINLLVKSWYHGALTFLWKDIDYSQWRGNQGVCMIWMKWWWCVCVWVGMLGCKVKGIGAEVFGNGWQSHYLTISLRASPRGCWKWGGLRKSPFQGQWSFNFERRYPDMSKQWLFRWVLILHRIYEGIRSPQDGNYLPIELLSDGVLVFTFLQFSILTGNASQFSHCFIPISCDLRKNDQFQLNILTITYYPFYLYQFSVFLWIWRGDFPLWNMYYLVYSCIIICVDVMGHLIKSWKKCRVHLPDICIF